MLCLIAEAFWHNALYLSAGSRQASTLGSGFSFVKAAGSKGGCGSGSASSSMVNILSNSSARSVAIGHALYSSAFMVFRLMTLVQNYRR